jgi:hypothetical protein
MEKKENLLDKIVSLCKRRGFVYPNAEIYGGFAGFWDYGPYGLALKNNIKNLWWKMFVDSREDMYGVDAAQVTKHEVLQASGHISGFSDPLADANGRRVHPIGPRHQRTDRIPHAQAPVHVAVIVNLHTLVPVPVQHRSDPRDQLVGPVGRRVPHGVRQAYSFRAALDRSQIQPLQIFRRRARSILGDEHHRQMVLDRSHLNQALKPGDRVLVIQALTGG